MICLKKLPPKRSVDHKIEIENNEKIPTRPLYRISFTEMEELQKQLKGMVEKGFIRPSVGPFGALGGQPGQ